MKKILFVTLVALFSISVTAFARGGSESERKAVEAIVDAYIKTINDGDLELVLRGKVPLEQILAGYYTKNQIETILPTEEVDEEDF